MILTNWFKKRKKEIQRKSKIQTAKKIIFGTAAGSLGGLLGGLLFSPKSGKETRKDIVDSSKDITNNIIEKTSTLKESIDNKVANAKDGITDAKSKISEYLNEKKPSKIANAANDEDLSPIVEQAEIIEKKDKK
ncbi:MAG TPA: YtxH domain-containing protein [Clostridium sp.]|uniref:YtxH domain-containing protein n=1 Tax=Clostridium sp. TaxID=1506 RepID=UPI002F955E0E